MKRGRVVFVVVLASSAVAVGAACSFPDVTFGPGGELSESGAPDVIGSDSSGDVDGKAPPPPPDVDPDGGSKDAEIYDGASKVDASGCTTCDCDNDSFFSKATGCDGGPGDVFDCDDTDPGINPDNDFFATPVWPSKSTPAYDWNCDGTVTKQYTYGVNCGALNLGGGCASISGFSGNPACGESAEFVTCRANALLPLVCEKNPTKTITRTQGCR